MTGRLVAALLAASALLLVTSVWGSALGATPLTGTGANVTWTSSSAASTTASGSFACSVSATTTMAAGAFNSGLAYSVDWSSTPATATAFSGGVSPASATAIFTRASGNSGTFAFGAELVDPVVLVAYIDPGSAIDFGPNAITVLSYHSSVAGAPTIVGNKISLDGPVVDIVDNGWAVQVTGHFGPTSGPLPFTAFSTADESLAVSVASDTACAPPTTTTTTSTSTTTVPTPLGPPGRPGTPIVTALPGALEITVVPPTTGGTPESYLVTIEPGGRTCTVDGASGSCTIDGLTDGSPYTVFSIASNAAGDSTASEATVPISALPAGLRADGLPTTGTSSTGIADVGLALVALGSILTWLNLRRHRIDASS